MKNVAELSHGIVDDFRERQKTRLQRTYVGAEDATKAKYNKGKSTYHSNLFTQTLQYAQFCFSPLLVLVFSISD